MALLAGDFPPGPYEATWGGDAIGLMEGSIFDESTLLETEIRASLYGKQVIDTIDDGMTQFIILMMKEWNTNAKKVFYPNAATAGTGGTHGKAGRLNSALSKALVLTALAGTPAATEGPVTRTYNYAKLAGGHNMRLTFGPEERNVPVVFRIFPEEVTSGSKTTKYFADT